MKQRRDQTTSGGSPPTITTSAGRRANRPTHTTPGIIINVCSRPTGSTIDSPCTSRIQFPLPVEVIPMARSLVARRILSLTGGQPVWRDGVTTDNGNWILDVHGLSIVDPVGLEQTLMMIPGVGGVGLFARRPADVVIVGGEPPLVV